MEIVHSWAPPNWHSFEVPPLSEPLLGNIHDSAGLVVDFSACRLRPDSVPDRRVLEDAVFFAHSKRVGRTLFCGDFMDILFDDQSIGAALETQPHTVQLEGAHEQAAAAAAAEDERDGRWWQRRTQRISILFATSLGLGAISAFSCTKEFDDYYALDAVQRARTFLPHGVGFIRETKGGSNTRDGEDASPSAN